MLTTTLDRLPQPLKSFIWSVRREIWEHRIVLAAPLGVAGLVLIGYLAILPFGLQAALADPAHRRATLALVINAATFICMIAALAAALFYCVEALHGERRDRAILFFKALPVSDTMTVTAKLCVPVLVLPVIVFAGTMALFGAILVTTSVILAIGGHAVAPLWSGFAVPPSCLVYALTIATLWYLPLYGALLVVSAAAKHAPVLWAGLPLLLLAALDRLVVHSGRVEAFYRYRLFGWMDEALRFSAAGQPVGRTFERFLTSPGLWLGLGFAVLALAAAGHLRRRATPL